VRTFLRRRRLVLSGATRRRRPTARTVKRIVFFIVSPKYELKYLGGRIQISGLLGPHREPIVLSNLRIEPGARLRRQEVTPKCGRRGIAQTPSS